MKEAYYIEIERYCDGLMSDDERTQFEKKLAENHELSAAYSEYRNLKKILEQAVYKEQRDKIRLLNEQSDRNTSFRWVLKIAAVIIPLLTIAFLGYYFVQDHPKDLAREYFEPYPDLVSTMAGSKPTEQDAINAYNSGNYSLALKLLQTHDTTSLLKLYTGVCYIGLDSCKQAQHVLKQLGASNLAEAAHWYQIIAALQCDDNKEAINLIDSYLGNSSYSFNRAKTQELKAKLH